MRSMEAPSKLPIDLKYYPQLVRSVNTDVYIPSNSSEPVVKVTREEVRVGLADGVRQVFTSVEQIKRQEEAAFELIPEASRSALVAQDYFVGQGEEPNTAHVVRIQKKIDGLPLSKLSYQEIMSLPLKDLATLRELLKASIKCYLKYGIHYDLSGSDNRDAYKKSSWSNFIRLLFPFRTSNNLMVTDKGIKLIDPNIFGHPDEKSRPLKKQFQ